MEQASKQRHIKQYHTSPTESGKTGQRRTHRKAPPKAPKFPPFTPGSVDADDLGTFALCPIDEMRRCAWHGCEARARIWWRLRDGRAMRPLCEECAIIAARGAAEAAWVELRECELGRILAEREVRLIRDLLGGASAKGSPLSRLRRVLYVAASHMASVREGEGYWSLLDGLIESWTLGGFYGEAGEVAR